MTLDLERDSASYDRIHKWLPRTPESDAVDRLVIRWPDGSAETLSGLPADQCITVRQRPGRLQRRTPRH